MSALPTARIGFLTPSSNTVLEPVSYRLLEAVPEVTLHFARFRVTRIGLDPEALQQFDPEPILEAAELLGDAKCDIIAWNGTAASWLGFERDRALCESIEARTRTPSTSTIIALNELFRRNGVQRFGLVTPYTEDVQDRIVANYQAAGYACAGARHLDLSDNFAFARIAPDDIAAAMDEVAMVLPDAIAVVCTNLRAAELVPTFERRTGVPVYDSVAVTLLRCLERVGIDPRRLADKGMVFGQSRGDA